MFPRLGEIYFGELLGGKFREKPIFKMSSINLKNNSSVLWHSKILAFDSQFMFGGSSMSVKHSKTT